jgi:hypothetical protein
MTTFWDHQNPPRLDRVVRPGVLTVQEVRAMVSSRTDDSARQNVATGLALLWHDHWDAAHEIAQSNEGDRDHDLLHAIVHRREGDFANSGFWFRGAGTHPCFDLIASRAKLLLAENPSLLTRLLPNGMWNSQAFVKVVEKSVKGSPDAEDEKLLRAIQAEEIVACYDWLTGERNL